MSNKSSYPDVVVNAFKTVQAWRALALVLLGVFFMQAFALMWLAGQRTVILVPQHLASVKQAVKLNLGEPYSPDYLSSVAKGDSSTLLNWTPDNIDTQYQAFLGRLTPSLHDAQREVLLAEAKSHVNDDLTQSFYVSRSYVKGEAVTLTGVLVRASGGREIYRGPAAYEFSYTHNGGLLMLSGVRQPTEKEIGALDRNASLTTKAADKAADKAAKQAAARQSK